MIIHRRFINDPIWAQELQNILYWGNIDLPISMASDLYKKSVRILGIESPLFHAASSVDQFNHKILQNLHDTIAAKFRYENRNNFERPLPGIRENMTNDDYLIRSWHMFYQQTLAQLFDFNTDLPRNILIAVIYPRPDPRGIEAEAFISGITKDIYEDIDSMEMDIKNERLRMIRDTDV